MAASLIQRTNQPHRQRALQVGGIHLHTGLQLVAEHPPLRGGRLRSCRYSGRGVRGRVELLGRSLIVGRLRPEVAGSCARRVQRPANLIDLQAGALRISLNLPAPIRVAGQPGGLGLRLEQAQSLPQLPLQVRHARGHVDRASGEKCLLLIVDALDGDCHPAQRQHHSRYRTDHRGAAQRGDQRPGGRRSRPDRRNGARDSSNAGAGRDQPRQPTGCQRDPANLVRALDPAAPGPGRSGRR